MVESYYKFRRALYLSAVGIGLLCTAMCYALPEMTDIRGPSHQQLEAEYNRQQDREAYHRGRERGASDEDVARGREACERNNEGYCGYERNGD